MERKPISPASFAQRLKVRDAACANCGHQGCDPAHLTARGQGGCDDPACVIGLCRSCHTRFDRGDLDLEPVIALRKFSEERSHMAHHLSFAQCIRRLRGNAAA